MNACRLLLILLVFIANAATANDEQDISVLKSRADAIALEFLSSLKPQLLNAVNSGGLAHAVTICAVKAPEIAKDLERETGWRVKRVSLKPRNNVVATADNYEKTILELFDKQIEKNATNPALTHHEIVSGEFRYLKAQPVQGICLGCHGQNIAEDVALALVKHYPEDTATGYQAGEIRGAISLRVKLPE